MKDLYADSGEEIPPNTPKPRGKTVQVDCIINSDNAGDRETRKFQTGIIFNCNSAPIIWYSKRPNTVESSTFGAEFVALRIATELIASLRYTLRIIGVPIERAANIFRGNECVYKND